MCDYLTVPLTLTQREFLNSHDFDLGFWWVDCLRFTCDPPAADETLIAYLLADAWYQHDYASPRGVRPDRQHFGVHGPYELVNVRPESFLPRDRERTLFALDTWLARIEPHAVFEREFRDLVGSFLPPGYRIYELPNLGEEKMHDYGFVVGADGGFNEFVAIAPDSRELTVLVATDD